jgi:hypothetical protein
MKTVVEGDALNAGCDLWLIADAERSSWSRKIDWHLNFQILRSLAHQTPRLSPELRRVLEDAEVEAPEIEATSAVATPLMIASRDLLPNRQTVSVPVPDEGGDAAWVKACHAVWNQLGRPRARVFLPDTMKPDLFSKSWPKSDADASVELVSGPSAAV